VISVKEICSDSDPFLYSLATITAFVAIGVVMLLLRMVRLADGIDGFATHLIPIEPSGVSALPNGVLGPTPHVNMGIRQL
jgi:hypothetical protein